MDSGQNDLLKPLIRKPGSLLDHFLFAAASHPPPHIGNQAVTCKTDCSRPESSKKALVCSSLTGDGQLLILPHRSDIQNSVCPLLDQLCQPAFLIVSHHQIHGIVGKGPAGVGLGVTSHGHHQSVRILLFWPGAASGGTFGPQYSSPNRC